MNKHRFHSSRLFYVFLVLAGICVPTVRGNAEPPPDPPLLAAAPDPFAWTIDIQHKKPRAATPSDPAQANTAKRLMDIYPRLLRQTVDKAGKNWHRAKYFDNQKQDNTWVCDGMAAVQFQHYPPNKIDVMAASSPNSPAKGGFGPDFPELSWVSAKYFIGTVTYAGQRCHLYQNKSAQPLPGRDALAPAPTAAGVSVWINAKTRLPVAVEDEDMIQRYSYRVGPAAIQPTGIFAEALARAPHPQNHELEVDDK